MASVERLREIEQAWVAVQVRSRREHITATQMRLIGCDVFLPRYREARQWSDRVKKVERALFTGYLFCRFYACLAPKIVLVPGVSRFVGDGDGPLAIPTSEVDALQRIVDAGLQPQAWPFPRVGERVHIEAGPLKGLEGVVQAVKNERRFVVSISLLQRAVAVEIDPEWLRVPFGGLPGCAAN